MKTGYAVALALAAFGAGALLTGVVAAGTSDMMQGWDPQAMMDACRSMMQSTNTTATP